MEVFIVRIAIAKPTIPIETSPVMCQKRSAIASECLRKFSDLSRHQKSIKTNRVTMNAVVKLRSHGGAQSKSVIVGLYPIVAARVGK